MVTRGALAGFEASRIAYADAQSPATEFCMPCTSVPGDWVNQ